MRRIGVVMVLGYILDNGILLGPAHDIYSGTHEEIGGR